MNPTLLITGGSRGIGAATALLAAQRGYRVAVNYTANPQAADEVVRQIRAGGGKALTVQADVGVEEQVMVMFQTIDVDLGRLTALVNNAGVMDVAARVDEMSVARLKRMFDINVLGSFLCAREAVKRMSPRHGGRGGAIGDMLQVSETIRSCRKIGVRFALDDFGTGHSSLTYLKRLPAEVLKIDQNFARNMLDDADNLTLVQGHHRTCHGVP